jgi:hypothetical protein
MRLAEGFVGGDDKVAVLQVARSGWSVNPISLVHTIKSVAAMMIQPCGVRADA